MQAAKRRAVAELIFFAGTNDSRRCKQIVATWNIDVSNQQQLIAPSEEIKGCQLPSGCALSTWTNAGNGNGNGNAGNGNGSSGNAGSGKLWLRFLLATQAACACSIVQGAAYLICPFHDAIVPLVPCKVPVCAALIWISFVWPVVTWSWCCR